VEVRKKLEKHYRDMQDIEFTIQEGKLWMLQTRNGKRTGFAAVRIAVDLVEEGLIEPREAVRRVEPIHIQQLLAPVFDAKQKKLAIEAGRNVAKGINASPGAACGRVALSANRAEKYARDGERSMLVRVETSPRRHRRHGTRPRAS
jgi:pyruvate,orthophosphate dikinase